MHKGSKEFGFKPHNIHIEAKGVGVTVCENNAAELQRDSSKCPYSSSEDDSEKTTIVLDKSGKKTKYRYLEWDTSYQEFCTDPDELPPQVKRLEDPFRWGRIHKNVVLALCCCSTFAAAYSATAYSSGLGQMSKEWDVGKIPLLVGITTYTAGFAVAPMVTAPLSEVYGRFPVFLSSFAIFNICHLSSALCSSFPGMLVARFFLGVGGSTFSSICGGVISDIYDAESRGFPMACFATGALFGTGAGPLVSGFIAQNLSWRWIHWVQLIFNVAVMGIMAIGLHETRGSVLLIRRAIALNKYLDQIEQQNIKGVGKPSDVVRVRWRAHAEDERTNLSNMLKVSLTRPFHLLFTEPVVFFFSLWTAFSWGILYLFIPGITLVFVTSHNFTTSQIGSVFTAMCVGSFLALPLNTLIERFTPVLLPSSRGPETRLYAACTLGVLLPIGIFWFGWTSSPDQHWILPTIAVGVATIGIFTIYLAVFNYFADTYHRYASSALAAQGCCRNIFAGFFPLVTEPMYAAVTLKGASSILGAGALVLSLVPWVLVFYGARIRARSKFASEIM